MNAFRRFYDSTVTLYRKTKTSDTFFSNSTRPDSKIVQGSTHMTVGF